MTTPPEQAKPAVDEKAFNEAAIAHRWNQPGFIGELRLFLEEYLETAKEKASAPGDGCIHSVDRNNKCMICRNPEMAKLNTPDAGLMMEQMKTRLIPHCKTAVDNANNAAIDYCVNVVLAAMPVRAGVDDAVSRIVEYTSHKPECITLNDEIPFADCSCGLIDAIDAVRQYLGTPPAADGRDIRQIAEANVLAVRGSHDAPGFDACVDAEMEKLRTQPSREGIGSPVKYTDGSYSREYEEQPSREDITYYGVTLQFDMSDAGQREAELWVAPAIESDTVANDVKAAGRVINRLLQRYIVRRR